MHLFALHIIILNAIELCCKHFEECAIIHKDSKNRKKIHNITSYYIKIVNYMLIVNDYD